MIVYKTLTQPNLPEKLPEKAQRQKNNHEVNHGDNHEDFHDEIQKEIHEVNQRVKHEDKLEYKFETDSSIHVCFANYTFNYSIEECEKVIDIKFRKGQKSFFKNVLSVCKMTIFSVYLF